MPIIKTGDALCYTYEQLTDEKACNLIEQLDKKCQRIMLRGNPITDLTIAVLAKKLPQLPDLRVLDLSNTRVTHSGLNLLITAVAAHRSLQSLDIGRVTINHSGGISGYHQINAEDVECLTNFFGLKPSSLSRINLGDVTDTKALKAALRFARTVKINNSAMQSISINKQNWLYHVSAGEKRDISKDEQKIESDVNPAGYNDLIQAVINLDTKKVEELIKDEKQRNHKDLFGWVYLDHIEQVVDVEVEKKLQQLAKLYDPSLSTESQIDEIPNGSANKAAFDIVLPLLLAAAERVRLNSNSAAVAAAPTTPSRKAAKLASIRDRLKVKAENFKNKNAERPGKYSVAAVAAAVEQKTMHDKEVKANKVVKTLLMEEEREARKKAKKKKSGAKKTNAGNPPVPHVAVVQNQSATVVSAAQAASSANAKITVSAAEVAAKPAEVVPVVELQQLPRPLQPVEVLPKQNNIAMSLAEEKRRDALMRRYKALQNEPEKLLQELCREIQQLPQDSPLMKEALIEIPKLELIAKARRESSTQELIDRDADEILKINIQLSEPLGTARHLLIKLQAANRGAKLPVMSNAVAAIAAGLGSHAPVNARPAANPAFYQDGLANEPSQPARVPANH
jgi:hypothetical protein